MNHRIFATTLAVLILGGLTSADVVVTKKGKIYGLPKVSKSKTKITIDNWRQYVDESIGDIV